MVCIPPFLQAGKLMAALLACRTVNLLFKLSKVLEQDRKGTVPLSGES